MTREDIEQLNVLVPYCFETDQEEHWYNIGLKHGLEIADEHPKLPWISVKEDLPCNHKELIVIENVCTKRVIAFDGDDFSLKSMIMTEGKWHWICSTKVKYWMPIPNLPK